VYVFTLLLILSLQYLDAHFYLLPDERERFLSDFKKDLKNSRQILAISREIEYKKIFYPLRKALNSGARLFIIFSEKRGDVKKLAIYKNSYLFQLPDFREERTDLSAISIDSKILYLFSQDLVEDSFESGYGYVFRTDSKKDVREFEKRFETLLERSERAK
jgi:rRNA maturation protein Rpf1